LREIVEPVDLCLPDGRLAPAAVGWSRRPLHRCNLRGGRKKRWDYWCFTDEQIFLALFVADLDYLALGALSLIDLESGERYERVVPFACPLPETVAGAPIHFDHWGLKLEIGSGAIRISDKHVRAHLEIAAPTDTLNVVVPWSDRRFQFTSKQIGLPARGRIEWNGRIINIARGWAALDFGRGKWPARTRWNWGAAAGGELAFNLGGRWTDGTGATENGLFVGGKLHKIPGAVEWQPGWRMRSGDVDLQFRPSYERRVGWPPRFGLHWCAGRFHGRILDQRIDGLFGWAEAVDVLW
jgi:hypothetical protein